MFWCGRLVGPGVSIQRVVTPPQKLSPSLQNDFEKTKQQLSVSLRCFKRKHLSHVALQKYAGLVLVPVREQTGQVLKHGNENIKQRRFSSSPFKGGGRHKGSGDSGENAHRRRFSGLYTYIWLMVHLHSQFFYHFSCRASTRLRTSEFTQNFWVFHFTLQTFWVIWVNG